MSDIVLDDVSRDFPAAGVVLRNVCLRVSSGERFALVGPSGSGKTTLLRLLAGLERPSTGRVLIGGQDVTGVPAHERQVAMVFQEETLLPHLTVGEQLVFGERYGRRATDGELQDRLSRVAQRLHIDSLLDRRCTELSAGERRRVSLGRALVRQAKVLLLDEPLSNLDAALQEDLTDLLALAVRETGATCVWVTHDQAEAQAVADRMGVLDNGELQQVGAPREVYLRPANRRVAAAVGRPRICLLDGTIQTEHDRLTFTTNGGWTFFLIQGKTNKTTQDESAAQDETAARAKRSTLLQRIAAGLPTRATCGIRPEWLRVSQNTETRTSDATADNVTLGVVTTVRAAGGQDLVGLQKVTVGKTDGKSEELTCYVPPGAVRSGHTVQVSLDEQRVQWFDLETGENLHDTFSRPR